MVKKPTEKQSRAELELNEVFNLLGEVKQELQKIKAITDDLYFKAQISHSLIVVRKVGEDSIA